MTFESDRCCMNLMMVWQRNCPKSVTGCADRSPDLERVVGPRLAHPAVVDLLGRYPTPAALQHAGRGHVRARLKKLTSQAGSTTQRQHL